MVIGRGLLASCLLPDFGSSDEWLIYASGVSNSQCQSEAEYARERDMLDAALKTATPLVYFSTCAVNQKGDAGASRYVAHKLAMEQRIRQASDRNVIFRLPQVVGRSDNPHTLCNFLNRKIVDGDPFHLWRQAERNLVDVDLVREVVKYTLANARPDTSTYEICAPTNIAMPDLVGLFEKVLDRAADAIPQDAGAGFKSNPDYTLQCVGEMGLAFGDNYYERLIRKYYGQLR